MTCAGAVIAAGFSIDKIFDIYNTQTLQTIVDIDVVNENLLQRTGAAAAMAVVAGIIIPVEISMVFLRLFQIKLGAFGRVLVILVRNESYVNSTK